LERNPAYPKMWYVFVPTYEAKDRNPALRNTWAFIDDQVGPI